MREGKKHFSPLRFYAVNIVLLVVLLITGFLAFCACACNVTSVEVKGNSIVCDQDIEDAVMTGKYRNNGAYDVVKSILRPADITFVDSVSVRLSGLHTLVIEVAEKEITGYIESKGSYIYLDKDGKVAEVCDTPVDGLIPVHGLTAKGTVTKGATYPAATNRVKALATVFSSMDNLGLEIDKVTFGSSGQITLGCKAITVSLGTADSLKDKLLRLSLILPKVASEKGTLHFEDYTADNTDIIFEAESM